MTRATIFAVAVLIALGICAAVALIEWLVRLACAWYRGRRNARLAERFDPVRAIRRND